MKKKMILLVSETGGGKNFFLNLINEYMSTKKLDEIPKLSPVVSYTTRGMRIGEQNGIDHYFITEEEASIMLQNENIIAYTKIKDPTTGLKGYEYFSTEKCIENANVYIIDPNGIKYLEEKRLDFDYLIVYIHTPFLLRYWRARKRSDFKTKFMPRCKNEKKQFKEFRKSKKYDMIIHNLPFLTIINRTKLYEAFKKFFNEGER